MSIDNTKDLLCEAIGNKNIITFGYEKEGDPTGIRIGNPHSVFIHRTTGNITVDVYQVDGVSKTGHKIPGWRPFLLKYITNLEIRDEVFDVSDEYEATPDSGKYDNALCKI